MSGTQRSDVEVFQSSFHALPFCDRQLAKMASLQQSKQSQNN